MDTGTLDWDLVRRRYAERPALRSLAGSSSVQVDDVDDEQDLESYSRIQQEKLPVMKKNRL